MIGYPYRNAIMHTAQIMTDSLSSRQYPGGWPGPALQDFIHANLFAVYVAVKLLNGSSNYNQPLIPVTLFESKQRPDSPVVAWIAAETVAGLGGVGDDPSCTQDGIRLPDEFAVQC